MLLGRWLPLAEPQPPHLSPGAVASKHQSQDYVACLELGSKEMLGDAVVHFLIKNLLCGALMAVNNCVHQISMEHLVYAKHLGTGERNVNQRVKIVCLHQAC